MANSFIEIEEFGFWANDGFVEAMQLCIINEIENQKLDDLSWINNYKNKLALQSLPLIFGGMSMELEFINTDERKEQLNTIIDVIIEKIDASDEYITGSNLHNMRYRAMEILSETGQANFKTAKDFDKAVNDARWLESDGVADFKDEYKHSFVLLKKLINGLLKTTAASPIDYWI